MIFISAQPDDTVFSWQTETFIENLISLGYSPNYEIRILLFVPHSRSGRNARYQMLENRYYNSSHNSNIKFYWYEDTDNFSEQMRKYNYISLLRPHILEKHFREYPHLTNETIFYHDSDIVFTKWWDIEGISNLTTDPTTCYLSDTRSYMNADYFKSKANDVLPYMKSEYNNIDVLDTISRQLGINKQICELYNDKTGGAQAILKNITPDFWHDVTTGCISIRNYLSNDINKKYFESETKGFQSWCADMWSLLWNLWKRGIPTEIPKSMDFAWPTDGIARWNEVNIYHDAGAGAYPDTKPLLFDKKDLKYNQPQQLSATNQLTTLPSLCNPTTTLTPFDEMDEIILKTSPKYCSYNYVKQMERVRNKYYSLNQQPQQRYNLQSNQSNQYITMEQMKRSSLEDLITLYNKGMRIQTNCGMECV